jgi:signal transduction histidine kinase
MNKLSIKGTFFAIFISCFGIFSSYYLSIELASQLEKQNILKLQNIAKQVSMRLQDAIDMTVNDLQALEAFYSANMDKNSKHEFDRYMSIIKINERPYIQALSWAPYVINDNRETFEANIKKEIPNFTITQRDENNTLVESQYKPSYTPVTYFSPFERNKVAQGFDLSSNTIRNASLEHARDTGKMTATAKVRLVQQNDDSYGFLIIAPVYNSNTALTTPLNRQHALKGYVAGVFKINKLMLSTIEQTDTQGLTFTLRDETDNSLLYGEPKENRLFSFNIGIPEHNWILDASLDKARLDKIAFPNIIVGVLIAGIVISLLLALCIYALQVSVIRTRYINSLRERLQVNNTKLEAQVEQRTKALEEKNLELNEHIEELTLQRKSLSTLMKEAKSAQAIAEERSIELIRSNQDLDDFAYVASHDLQAPLRGIDQLASWIAEDVASGNNDEVIENVGMMRSRVQRLESLLADLLTYSRANKTEQKIKKVNSYELIKDCFSIITPPAGFNIKLDDNLPTFLTAKAPFEQVIRNLLNNAMKHNDKLEGFIHVSCNDAGDFYQFSFQDNGPGISADYHEDIFKMFKTLKPRDEIEGSGMGLALIKKIVEYYRGEVGVSSIKDQGSTFYFTWPKQL